MGRTRIGFAGIAISSLILSSGAVVTAQDDPVELTATVIGIGTTPGAFTAAADVWNEANPGIQVRVEPRPEEQVWQTTAPTTEFQASDGPDFSWWWCGLPQNFREMSSLGMLAPIEDLWEEQGWAEAGPQWAVDYYTDADGHMYGAPIDLVWTPIIYYNKGLFEELGLSEPTTWDEFFEVTSALDEAGKIPLAAVYDMQFGNHLLQALQLRSWSQDEYTAFTQNWSGSADPATFEYKWTDPSSVRIFETMATMRDSGIWGDGFQSLTDYAQAQSLFLSEAAGMYSMGSWAAAGEFNDTDIDVGWFFYPTFDDTESLGAVGSWPANCFIVFEDRPHVAESKEFLAWLYGPEGMEVWLTNGGSTPALAHLPEETLALLDPREAALAQEIIDTGSGALWEAYVSPDIFQGIKDTVDLLFADAMTPEEVAEEIQSLTEESREVN